MSSRNNFLLMLGFFAAPMLAAWIAYLGWHPDRHKNYGSLLPVAPLTDVGGTLLEGTSFKLDALKGKWLMVYIGEARCDTACVKLLYYLRQSHISLGKDQDRVERIWILTGTATPDPRLIKAHPGLRVWRPDHVAFIHQFPVARAGAHSLYLVDPLGNLIMRFPENADPKGVIKDMKLLLKASQIG